MLRLRLPHHSFRKREIYRFLPVVELCKCMQMTTVRSGFVSPLMYCITLEIAYNRLNYTYSRLYVWLAFILWKRYDDCFSATEIFPTLQCQRIQRAITLSKPFKTLIMKDSNSAYCAREKKTSHSNRLHLSMNVTLNYNGRIFCFIFGKIAHFVSGFE